MNGINRTSLVIGMLTMLVGIFSSAVLAEGLESESTVDATVVQVAHWQAMSLEITDSTVAQVAHWQAMNPEVTDSTVAQVAHWQAINSEAIDSTVAQVAHWQAMSSEVTDSTVTQVAHRQAMAEINETHELVNIESDAVAEAFVQR
jgi:hypothetical protein